MLQPEPKPNDSVPVWEQVIQDMRARDEQGFKTYGTRLQSHNGRNSIVDMHDELLDAVVYSKTFLLEANDMKNELDIAIQMLKSGRYDECEKHLEVLKNWAPFLK